MATGRTISANFLTAKDRKIIELCKKISTEISDLIEDAPAKKEFLASYGKISLTRDGGAGRGGGKLQRDALCTRGRQGKAPFSNRNLRWHPLLAAEVEANYADPIDSIEIEGEGESQTLNFVIDGNSYPSARVHELEKKYVVLPRHWMPHIETLKMWNDNLWTQNSCIIPALEACDWWDSIETYALLGEAIALELFSCNQNNLFVKIRDILAGQEIDSSIELPSSNFPENLNDIGKCPMCKVKINNNAAQLSSRARVSVWQPAWRSTKRDEGEDSSIQLMHIDPLIDGILKHNASNTRYGHRWCNVAMTDHSLNETLDFMEYIVRVHNRVNNRR